MLQEMRRQAGTREWQEHYGRRAGIEGTLSQAIRALGLRQSRYRGLAKTHLQHILIAVALNVVRLMAWWKGVARAATRLSHFAALQSAAT